MTLLATYGLIGLVLALGLTPLCRRLAVRLGYVARPKEDRWHKKPTALLGGIAIFLSVAVPFVILQPLDQAWLLVAGGAAVFALGLVDDLRSVTPTTKLAAQIALASTFVFFDYRLGWLESLTLDALLTFVWIVGITNALNLLDNMDGLCGGITVIAALALLAGTVPQTGVTPTALYLALLTGATCGFLVYNIHPASIFLGDAGSLFVGLTIAAASIDLSQQSAVGSNVLAVMAAPVLVLLIPIFDTTLVTVSRLWVGRRPSQGGRDHSSHRLVAIGLPERTAVAVLWGLATLSAVIGWTVGQTDIGWSGPPAALLVLGMILLAIYLSQVRVYDPDQIKPGGGKITPFVIDFMYKRRVAEVLLDLCLVAIAYYAAYRLRFEGAQYRSNFQGFLNALPIVLGVQMVALVGMGVYRAVWHRFSLMDGVAIVKAVMVGTAGIAGIIFAAYRFVGYSRGVFITYTALATLLLMSARASFRLMGEFVRRRRDGRRLIVYGAGDNVPMVVSALLDGPIAYRMVGFVDDDPRRHRTSVHGYPVLGGYDTLTALITTGAVDHVVISARMLSVDRQHDLERLCTEHGKTLSRLHVEFQSLIAAS